MLYILRLASMNETYPSIDLPRPGTLDPYELLELPANAARVDVARLTPICDAPAGAIAEKALMAESDFVSAVLDKVGALVIVFDAAGRIVRFNRACEALSGYTSQDLLGKHAWERLIPAEDISAYIENFVRIRDGGFPFAFEDIWLSADGIRRRISWSTTALVDSKNQVEFLVATGFDVTVQRVAEATIRESEARYRQLIESSLGMICTHDLEGVILSINTHGAEGIGRTVDEMIGRPLTEFVYPQHLHLLGSYFNLLHTFGEAQGLLHWRHTDDKERVTAYRNRLIEEPGRPPYVLAFGVDITEQMRAEEQLRALIRASNSVLESVGDGIYSIDLEGRVTVVNPAAAQMLGYRPEEILGMNMHDLVHHTYADGQPYPHTACPVRRSLTNHETVRISHEVFWRKDGTSFPVEYVARPQIEAQLGAHATEPSPLRGLTPPMAPILGRPGIAAESAPEVFPKQPKPTRASNPAYGHAVGVVVAFTDISERNALDRMKDEFISTVSHELRTPLTSLRAALGLVSGGALVERPEKVRQMMEIAIGNTDRLVRLVNDILDLESLNSGKAELHCSMCSVSDLFRRTTASVQTSAAQSNIHLIVEPNGVSVWADPDRILQMLNRLVANAIRFSSELGVANKKIHISASHLPNGAALIRVSDQGRGIPSEKLEVIFERFKQIDASDSRATGGTGLGLAICRSIVTQHGGRIWATSEPGEGSSFQFTLPTKPSSDRL